MFIDESGFERRLAGMVFHRDHLTAGHQAQQRMLVDRVEPWTEAATEDFDPVFSAHARLSEHLRRRMIAAHGVHCYSIWKRTQMSAVADALACPG